MIASGLFVITPISIEIESGATEIASGLSDMRLDCDRSQPTKAVTGHRTPKTKSLVTVFGVQHFAYLLRQREFGKGLLDKSYA